MYDSRAFIVKILIERINVECQWILKKGSGEKAVSDPESALFTAFMHNIVL